MDVLKQPALVFKGVNIAVGGLLIAGAVGHFIWHSIPSVIVGVYSLLFGVSIIGLEFVSLTQPQTALLYRYASFLFSFAGRGVFYLLAGVLLLSHYTLLYVSGSIVGLAGVVYFTLEFLQMFPLPESMVPPLSAGGIDEEAAQPVWAAQE